jgi:hypothetical protein
MGNERNGLYFPTPKELAANTARNALIYDTLDKMAYNDAHTTTVYDNRNRPVTLHNIDEANSFHGELLRQFSSSLSGIENMAAGGCNFMAIISIPQLLLKQSLNAQQISDIWENAIGNDIMRSDGFVWNRNALANLALQELGISNFGINLSGTDRINSSLVGYRVGVPYGAEGSHFVLTGTNRSLIYNPGRTYTSDQNIWRSIVEVMVYGK